MPLSSDCEWVALACTLQEGNTITFAVCLDLDDDDD